MRRAAAASPDSKTVALVFGTKDFVAHVLNWACHALALGCRWFVLVAMDSSLHRELRRLPAVSSHTLFLPRVREGTVNVTKLNVIGERQRLGLSVLERGFSIVHSDADALWIRDPWPLLETGDVIAERIWGKPLSVVQSWGAGICTGFYFLRSKPPVIALAREVRDAISAKRRRQTTWQASDQYYVNTILGRRGVKWVGGQKMAPMTSMSTRFYEHSPHVGMAAARGGSNLTIVMLAHSRVPRACPVLSSGELRALERGNTRGLSPKARLWQSLLQSAYVLHCFPPDPQLRGERRSVFMGHPKRMRCARPKSTCAACLPTRGHRRIRWAVSDGRRSVAAWCSSTCLSVMIAQTLKQRCVLP